MDRKDAMIRDAIIQGRIQGEMMGLPEWRINAIQSSYVFEVEERERKEKLKSDLDQMYALAQYLHDHGAPINKKGLDILRRYGYDVSAFED